MVCTKHPCKDHEQECDHNEKHPHCHHMVLLLLIVFQVEAREAVPRPRNLKRRYEMQRLYEEKQPELTVVELPNAAANPEAVVVKFSNAAAAVLAVSWSEWHYELALVAEFALGQCDFFGGALRFG